MQRFNTKRYDSRRGIYYDTDCEASKIHQTRVDLLASAIAYNSKLYSSTSFSFLRFGLAGDLLKESSLRILQTFKSLDCNAEILVSAAVSSMLKER